MMNTSKILMSGLLVASALSLTACSPKQSNTAAVNRAQPNNTSQAGNSIANSPSGNSTTTGNNAVAGTQAGDPIGNVSVDKGFQPYAVQIIDFKHAFLAGSNTLYATDNGGTAWRKVWHGHVTFFKLDFENTQDGFAIVDKGSNTAQMAKGLQLWHTTDGGAHWSVAATQQQMGVSSVKAGTQYSLRFTSRDTGLITMSPGGLTIVTRDGGSTWKRLPVPAHTIDAAFTGNGSVGYALAHGTNKYVFEKTSDSGAHWTTLKTISAQVPYRSGSVKVYGNHSVWIQVLGGVGMNQASYTLYRSPNAGRTWDKVIAASSAGGGPAPDGQSGAISTKGPGSEPGMLDVVSPNLAYFTGNCPACGSYGQVQVARIGSTSVRVLPPKVNGMLSWVLFLDPTHGWLVASFNQQFTNVYQTANGGESWQLRSQFQTAK